MQPPATVAATDSSRFARPSAVEVDHGAIARNLGRVATLVGEGVKVFAALKANAYGLGLVPVAQTLCAAGVHAIAVADTGDAMTLRGNGIGVPILLYGGALISVDLLDLATRHDLTLTVHHPRNAEDIARLARRRLSVFIKVNVGLQRLGLDAGDIEAAILALQGNSKVAIGGLYTHMYVPDDAGAAQAIGQQFEAFANALGVVARLGIEVEHTMVASSGVLQLTNEMNLTAVDPGQLLFGFASHGRDPAIAAEPALRAIRSRLISVRDVGTGDGPRPAGIEAGARIGVIPLGLRDGFPRFAAGHVLVNSKAAPLLGRSTLEHTRLDLSGVPEAQVGDAVVILGRQGEREITADEIVRARRHAAVVELTMAISPDVPRHAIAP